MTDPNAKETRGVPWGDHNETESSPPDTRREEYGDGDPSETADERAAGSSSAGDNEAGDGTRDGEPSSRTSDENPIHDA